MLKIWIIKYVAIVSEVFFKRSIPNDLIESLKHVPTIQGH